MGGHIHASSTQGVGSRFWLELPLAQPSAPQWQAVAVQDVVLPSLAAAKILVAEDNKINQLVITKLIERLGGTVTLVENGELAVEEVKRQAYDMVFMDCQMPVMDGFEATRQIRQWEDQHAVAKALPIVALTANALASDRDECIAAGMTDFASKPINGETLKKVLYRHLNLAPDGQTLA
jgi:CheY-like chemotaxis protein